MNQPGYLYRHPNAAHPSSLIKTREQRESSQRPTEEVQLRLMWCFADGDGEGSGTIDAFIHSSTEWERAALGGILA